MVQVSWGSSSTTAILPHASSYGHIRKLHNSSESDLQSSVERVVCVHTHRLRSFLTAPAPGELFPGPSTPRWLQIPHVKQARGISKERSETRICITSKAQRGEERNLPAYQPAPPSSMRNKIKRKKRLSLC